MVRLRPARSESQESVKILSDFDSFLTEKVGIKFKNKTHLIQPVDVKNFMQITLAYQNLLKMIEDRSQGVELGEDEVFEKYYELIHPVVPTIEYAELRSMTLVMLNNLINLIFRQLAGDPSLYEKGEKKNPLMP